MAEPQPSNVQEGADPPDALPVNAEDRKAAQALSSLDAKGDDDTATPKKEVDLKALSEAMKNLDMSQKSAQSTGGASSGSSGAAVKKDEAPKKLVKVDAADVALVAEQLDLSKPKATDLLRAHDANVLKAMTAWVTASP